MQLRLGGQRVIDECLTPKMPDRTAAAPNFYPQLELISRHHLTPKAASINAGKQRHFVE
jgi:hypothetical protein